MSRRSVVLAAVRGQDGFWTVRVGTRTYRARELKDALASLPRAKRVIDVRA